MKKAAVVTAFAFLAGIAGTGTVFAADAMKDQQKQSSQMQSQSGQAGQQQIRTASDLEKFSVQTAQGEKLGKVDKVVVDLQQGQIAYVTLSGQGQKNLIIPWKALQAQPQQQTLVLNMSADKLQQAPKGDIQQLSRDQGRQIHQFYGVAPYWEGGQQQQQQQPMQQMDHQMDKSQGTMMDREQSEPRQQPQPGRGM